MITLQDEMFLRRAMRLAMNGRGYTEPNPSVGCVLVKNGQTIGEGWTQAFGGDHAEPTALADCKAQGNDPAGATVYVTLEPCCHTNKKTPPCAPRLIEAKVARVVIGCLDPNPDVNGKGVAMLRAAGMKVEQVADAAEFKQLIAPFILGMAADRPYVTLKWAQSADAKVAASGGQRTQISNESSSRFVHQLRSRSDGIMIGISTLLNDSPRLDVRGVHNLKLKHVYVLDSSARTPMDSALIDGRDITIFLVSWPRLNDGRFERAIALQQQAGVRSWAVDADRSGRTNLATVFKFPWLARPHLLVEPGPTVAHSFFAEGLCDRLFVIRSPKSIGDSTAPAAAEIPSTFVKTDTLSLAGDTLTEYLNTASPAFFAAVPSADFVLASESMTRAFGA